MAKARSQKVLETDKKVTEALAALSLGTFPNVFQAAKHFKIPHNTLGRRYNGGKSIAESRELYQLLTIAEENSLALWITRLTTSGYPVTYPLLREMAEEIRSKRLRGINDPSIQLVVYDPIGEQWTQRFLQRHPHCKTAMGRSIEASRVKAASLEDIKLWYEVLFLTIEEHKISWRNTYNQDETGFGIGTKGTSHVIIDSRVKTAYQAQPGRQEWVTVIECICADGSSIPPLIIFKGENICKNWIPKQIPSGWHISVNSKGWTSNIHGQEWLEKCFEPATRDKAGGEMRLLICDGHDSHISSKFIRHCIQHDIVLLLLLPHTSHLLQPLDVSVFGPLKKEMANQLDRIFRTGISTLQKVEWFEAFIPARAKAVNLRNIRGGWRGAGIYPMNPARVLDKLIQLQPELIEPSLQSEATSQNNTVSFDNTLATDTPIDATGLHSANTALNGLLQANQPLHTPVRKYIPRLASTAEWLLAENTILHYEVKRCQDLLGARKLRTTGKRNILKGRIVISLDEVVEAIEAAEKATEAKKKVSKGGTGRPRGRPRKNPVVALALEVEDIELEALEYEEATEI